ncbi:short-chain dehydrogenase [Variovorax paradoxus]|jgi:hypothetical protein|uniref:short-chain dehydrogenase n=1 Tax=Variovorax paradoxus TaxID=34073 RepID=UPI0029C8745C|nr:short-chain dehydrogenase [Variovorax paradoxus]WPH22005.1 short-chain dehydrogenase [Variovorax paradoxus]
MRKRSNTPIRMIAVRPAPPRRRMAGALAQRLGIGSAAAGQGAAAPSLAPTDRSLEYPDLDQRVREVGEW